MDTKIKIWDLKQGKLAYTLYAHNNACTSCVFSPAGDYFASGGMDTLVMLWKTNFINSGTEIY